MRYDLEAIIRGATLERVNDFPYEKIAPLINSFRHFDGVYAPPGREHYRLLSYLASHFNGDVLYDVGTWTGLSAISMATNQSNRVISYDIGFFIEVNRPENVEFRIGDVFNEKTIFESPFIFVDVDPHDGIFEKLFIEHLRKNKYKGLVGFDDIHLNEEMREIWASITEKKFDLTEVGHWSGTGLAIFE